MATIKPLTNNYAHYRFIERYNKLDNEQKHKLQEEFCRNANISIPTFFRRIKGDGLNNLEARELNRLLNDLSHELIETQKQA